MLVKFFKKFTSIGRDREELINNAKREAEIVILKANQEAFTIKDTAEKESRKLATDALEIEKRLAKREQSIEDKEILVNKERQSADDIKRHLEKLRVDLEKNKEAMLAKLEKIAQLTKDQAKELLLAGWEDKLKGDIAKKIKAAEEEIKSKVDDRAKHILVDSMRYGAVDYTAEYTLSVINLPSEDFKGRIIGKDGRNIRAFEIATGVDVDLEEEGVIRLSSFDAARREVARQSLERLIKDGRIQPARIEEIVKKTREDIDKSIFKAGEDLAHRVGV